MLRFKLWPENCHVLKTDREGADWINADSYSHVTVYRSVAASVAAAA